MSAEPKGLGDGAISPRKWDPSMALSAAEAFERAVDEGDAAAMKKLAPLLQRPVQLEVPARKLATAVQRVDLAEVLEGDGRPDSQASPLGSLDDGPEDNMKTEVYKAAKVNPVKKDSEGVDPGPGVKSPTSGRYPVIVGIERGGRIQPVNVNDQVIPRGVPLRIARSGTSPKARHPQLEGDSINSADMTAPEVEPDAPKLKRRPAAPTSPVDDSLVVGSIGQTGPIAQASIGEPPDIHRLTTMRVVADAEGKERVLRRPSPKRADLRGDGETVSVGGEEDDFEETSSFTQGRVLVPESVARNLMLGQFGARISIVRRSRARTVALWAALIAGGFTVGGAGVYFLKNSEYSDQSNNPPSTSRDQNDN